MQSHVSCVCNFHRRHPEQSFVDLIQADFPDQATNHRMLVGSAPIISYANLNAAYLYSAAPSVLWGSYASFPAPAALTSPANSLCPGHLLTLPTQKRDDPPKADHPQSFQDQSVCKNDCKSHPFFIIRLQISFSSQITSFLNKINHLRMICKSICMCQNDCIPTFGGKNEDYLRLRAIAL